MRTSCFVAVLAALLVWESAACAADLDKMNRTIKKEPAYRFKPKYCLLVFGPEAKHRVWLVMDGDVLYADRKGNGDLTTAGSAVRAPAWSATKHLTIARERSVEVGDLTVGGLTHARLLVSQTQYLHEPDFSAVADTGDLTRAEWQRYLDAVWRQVPDGVTYTVSISLDCRCYGRFGNAKGRRPVRHFASHDRNGQLALAGRAADAPVIHFGGPLTLDLRSSERLQLGIKPREISVSLGTRGVGPGTFAVMFHDHVPEDVSPIVEVQLPKGKSEEKAVIRKYALERCCGYRFHCPVWIPDEAGVGTAKLTMSFDEWKEGNVKPAIADIQVDPAPRGTPKFPRQAAVDHLKNDRRFPPGRSRQRKPLKHPGDPVRSRSIRTFICAGESTLPWPQRWSSNRSPIERNCRGTESRLNHSWVKGGSSR